MTSEEWFMHYEVMRRDLGDMVNCKCNKFSRLCRWLINYDSSIMCNESHSQWWVIDVCNVNNDLGWRDFAIQKSRLLNRMIAPPNGHLLKKIPGIWLVNFARELDDSLRTLSSYRLKCWHLRFCHSVFYLVKLRWIFFKWRTILYFFLETGKRYRPNSFFIVIYSKFVWGWTFFRIRSCPMTS